MVPLKSLLCGIVALVALFCLVHGAEQASFEVHRLLQHSVDGVTYGSQKAAVNLAGVTSKHTSSLQGYILTLKVEETELKTLKSVRKWLRKAANQQSPVSRSYLIPLEF